MLKLHSTKIKGFTLIELMITVSIIGVLAAIALPNYTNYIRKSKRQVAISDMLLIKQAQEKYRTNHLVYAPNGGLIGVYGVTYSSKSTDYSFQITNDSATGYEITATPLGSQALGNEAVCSSLKLTSDDTRTPPSCWGK
jgi:type IV pilus assembly protein PilE